MQRKLRVELASLPYVLLTDHNTYTLMLITLCSVHQMPTFHVYNSKSPSPGHDYAEMRGAAPKKLEVSVGYFEPILVVIYLGFFYSNSSMIR